jgi:hypothetical protein
MKFNIQSTLFASLVLLMGTAAAAPIGDDEGDLNVSRILAESSRANVQVAKRQILEYDDGGVITGTRPYTPYTPVSVGTDYRRS